jgi:caffeoyl-CoA O-methyltransferase
MGKFHREDPLLSELRKKSIENKIPIVSDDAGSLLELASFIYEPDNILEIGCGIGYSTYYILGKASSTGRKVSYTGIDLNKERLIQASGFINEYCRESISKNIINIKFLAENALKVIPEFDVKFDFVFIDGAKFEYPGYLKAIIPKLRKGSIVIADNVFYSGKIFKENVSKHDYNSVKGITEYIDLISDKNNFETLFIDAGDGVSFSIFAGSD